MSLGRERFAAETGIKESYWKSWYWVTWNEVVTEASYTPNTMNSQRYDDDYIVRWLALFTRKLSRFPTDAHFRLERRSGDSLPNANSIRERLGDEAAQVTRVRAFAAIDESFGDVYEILSMKADDDHAAKPGETVVVKSTEVVYLIKSGRFYKAGR